MIFLWLIGTPMFTGIAWWLWSLRDRSAVQKQRRRLVLMGLLTASANAFIYYSWLLYCLIIGSTPLVWKLKDTCGDIGGYLVLLALAGAIFGKGAPRVPIAICALLGFMNWVPLAIL